MLASSGIAWDNFTVELWDMVMGEHRGTLTRHTYGFVLAFSPDSTTLASGRDIVGSVSMWNAVTGERKQRIFPREGYDITSLAFSPDGVTLAIGVQDATVRLWNVDTSEYKASLTGHTKSVINLAFSPDGKTLASGSEDATVRLWNAVTGEHKGTLTGHTNSVIGLAYSPDGKTLASGSSDSVYLWDGKKSQT